MDEAAARATAERLRQPGVEITPRRQWPSGLSSLGVSLSGRIAAEERAEPGRALGRLTDIGWGGRLRELLGRTAPDGPVPEQVFNACIQVLVSWDWERRPVAVVGVPSARRPQLVRDLVDRISQIGRLHPLGFLEVHGGPGPRANSALRVAGLAERLHVPDALAAELTTVEGPVLLVDDQTDSGWTLTMAARLLRNAGAPAVLPFVLAAAN